MAGPAAVSGAAITSDSDYTNRTAWRTLTTTGVKRRAECSPCSTRVTQTSPLLALPAELRTIIFELVVLHESGWIEINEKLRVPTLLGVCVQVRDEASVLYHRQNKFWYDARYWSTESLNKWSIKTPAATFKNLDVYVFLPTDEDRIDWLMGLIVWCMDIWDHWGTRTVIKGEGMDETEKFVCKALSIAENEDKRFEDWIDAKEHLEDMGLDAEPEVSIQWAEYTFVDGFDYEGEDCFEKVCWHTEKEREEAGCKYCRLSPGWRPG